ncbi:MAG: hypothetical protein GY794_16170 [bacterium]|nr:hypothetical protein [bacterium]
MSDIKPEYQIGDEVFWQDFNDEPLIHGIVVEVHPYAHHTYYYIDYETQRGVGMRAGMGDSDILGKVPRVEKVINPPLELGGDNE